LAYFQRWLLVNGLVNNGVTTAVEEVEEAVVEAVGAVEVALAHNFLLLDQPHNLYLPLLVGFLKLEELGVADLQIQEVLILVEFLIQEF
jgi:hypothetical protein